MLHYISNQSTYIVSLFPYFFVLPSLYFQEQFCFILVYNTFFWRFIIKSHEHYMHAGCVI